MGGASGKGENPAPDSENMLEKNGVISEGSIISKKFSKIKLIIKNLILL